MLLPSDIARLVLGYLQQEGLSSTSRAFIQECPNLKEYAEHSTEDGLIPACVFSLFGKNLKTILNEYVASKTKEISQENQVPAMLTSLWKKLDVTLNQIKCMQNSPIVYSSQRMRTKNGIIRSRALASPISPNLSGVSLSGVIVPSPSPSIVSPISTPQAIFGHSTPVCVSSQQARAPTLALTHPPTQDGARLSINLSHNSPLQIVVPDQRILPGPLSPARRKCDSPRRRGGCVASGSGTTRANITVSGLTQETQAEEVASENFPQMVIENARDKILKDRSLQEKLAENINKILASDNSPQASKAACSSVDQDQSIDEILGLQGEIHMTDDAIHDILEQTESDPAFQALFDLFDYGKGKTTGTEEAETSQRDQENEETSYMEEPVDSDPIGPTQEESASCPEPPSVPRSRPRGAQEAKNKRKPTVSSSTPKNPPPPAAPQPPSALLPSQPASDTPAAVTGRSSSTDPKQRASRRHPRSSQNSSLANHRTETEEETVSMDVDEPFVETVCVSLTPEQPQANKATESEQTPATAAGSSQLLGTTCGLLMRGLAPGAAACSEEQEAVEGAGAGAGAGVGVVKTPEVLAGSNPNKEPGGERNQSRNWRSASSSLGKSSSQGSGAAQKSQTLDITRGSRVSAVSPLTAAVRPTAVSVPSSSCPAQDADPSQIVSLKIIVSDEQEQQQQQSSSSDACLSQAVSSISEERIPTIYLSSPAKSPAKGLLQSASSSGVTPEETVQAVSCLQRTEITQDSHQSSALVVAGDSPQESGFIRLLPAGAAPSSYFVVTDQMVPRDHQSSVVVVPGASATQGPVATLPQVLATPPRSSALAQPYGSTFIISSPVQSMLQSVVLPMSVMGQNNTGKFTVVPNQVLTLPCTTSVTQPATLVAKPNVAPRQDPSNTGKTTAKSGAAPPSKTSAQTQKVAAPAPPSAPPQPPKAATPLLPVSTESAKTGGPQGHVRMLCFDTPSSNTQTPPAVSPSPSSSAAAPIPASVASGSGSPPSQTKSPVPISTPPSEKQASRDGGRPSTPKPIILGGGNRSKRRVETVRVEDHTPQPSAFTSNQSREASGGKDGIPDAPKAAAAAATAHQGTTTRSESRRKPQMTEKVDSGSTLSEVTPVAKPSEHAQRQRTKSSGAKRDAKESGKQDAGKGQDGRSQPEERTAPPQEASPVTSNKENELEGKERSQPVQQESTSAASAAPSKALSKTSPLTKQAAEMLQDIQGLHPTTAATPKKQGLGCLDLPLPRTPGLGRLHEDLLEGLRTPGRQRLVRDGEGTPRHLLPPATPELPSCSPASETGSENSINMAAHTLMILSRAARTGGPLKDSLRQEEAAISTVTAKSKKRKHSEPSAASGKKDHSSSSSKKKTKKQKKLLDSFPDDLDVDKFLSSLHYDE